MLRLRRRRPRVHHLPDGRRIIKGRTTSRRHGRCTRSSWEAELTIAVGGVERRRPTILICVGWWARCARHPTYFFLAENLLSLRALAPSGCIDDLPRQRRHQLPQGPSRSIRPSTGSPGPACANPGRAVTGWRWRRSGRWRRPGHALNQSSAAKGLSGGSHPQLHRRLNLASKGIVKPGTT